LQRGNSIETLLQVVIGDSGAQMVDVVMTYHSQKSTPSNNGSSV
jgi:hypothetical protein